MRVLVAFAVVVASAGPPAAAGGEPSLLLRAGELNPRRQVAADGAAALPEGAVLRAARIGPGRYRLLQLAGPVRASTWRELKSLGFEPVGYVPRNAVLVRLPQGGLPAEALARVAPRWIGPVRPAYKVAPGLLGGDRSGASSTTLDVALFPGEDAAALVDAVEAAYAEVAVRFVRSRGTPRVVLEVPAGRLPAVVGSLARDAAVQFVAERAELVPLNDHAVWIGQSYDRINGPAEAQAGSSKSYPLAATVWNRGLRGEGQIVAVADTGLEHEMCFFRDPLRPVSPQQVTAPGALAVDAAHRKVIAYNAPLAIGLDHDDAFRHGTHTAGSAVGNDLDHPGHDHGDGMAPEAKLVFEDVSGSPTSGCSTWIRVDSVEDLLVQEYAAGARISSNSWGSAAGASRGAGLESFDADAGAWQMEDFLVLFAAGNDGGAGFGGFPACRNCVAVGASENYAGDWADAFGILDPENMTNFSSRGPTSDGRLKPDIVAPGYKVESSRFAVQYVSDGASPACQQGAPGIELCFPGFGGCYRTDAGDSCHVDTLLGTSMSTPLAAGLATLARQYFTDGFYPGGAAAPADARVPSAALLKAMLVNGARNMTGRRYERRGTPVDHGPLDDAPSNTQGWGRLHLDDALYFSGDARKLRVWELFNADGLATGESFSETLEVVSSDEPLKLSLVWTDAPGLPISSGTLVNDLDLVVHGPDGRLYRGNRWTADDPDVAGDKESIADPVSPDSVNNVEGVLLRSPTPGVYTVTVEARDVPGTPEIQTQGAALVATGSIETCTGVAAPANLVVRQSGPGAVELGWDAVPGALAYTVYRNDSSCTAPFKYDSSVEVDASASAHLDTAVLPDRLYHYTVRATMSPGGCETGPSACRAASTDALASPPAVPDGAFGGPLRAARAGAKGSAIDVEWDAASCPAIGYHLLFGDLASVADPVVAGARCDLGTTGVFNWTGVSAGDLWFLVVADDGVSTEGSWGTTSAGPPRGGGAASGQCGVVARVESGACP